MLFWPAKCARPARFSACFLWFLVKVKGEEMRGGCLVGEMLSGLRGVKLWPGACVCVFKGEFCFYLHLIDYESWAGGEEFPENLNNQPF